MASGAPTTDPRSGSSDAAAALHALLPDEVVAVAADVATEPPPLYPDELAAVARAVASRRREFALGRQCARLALGRLGAAAGAIPVGADRAPVWPSGVTGSITHCAGVVAAAVAWSRALAGLGIDVEPAGPLDPALLPLICGPDERWLVERTGRSWGKLLFSAKESLFKCVFPRTKVFLELRDVALDVRPDGTFTATSALVDLSTVRGRWAETSTHVVTSATLR